MTTMYLFIMFLAQPGGLVENHGLGPLTKEDCDAKVELALQIAAEAPADGLRFLDAYCTPLGGKDA